MVAVELLGTLTAKAALPRLARLKSHDCGDHSLHQAHPIRIQIRFALHLGFRTVTCFVLLAKRKDDKKLQSPRLLQRLKC
jgi:hypothetical protein